MRRVTLELEVAYAARLRARLRASYPASRRALSFRFLKTGVPLKKQIELRSRSCDNVRAC